MDCTAVLSCGIEHCCILFPCEEKVKCWGYGTYGQIGKAQGVFTDTQLANLEYLPFISVVRVIFEEYVTCLEFREEGELCFSCCGKDFKGQLLNPTAESYGYYDGQYGTRVEDAWRMPAATLNAVALLHFATFSGNSCAGLSQMTSVGAANGRLLYMNELKCWGSTN